MDKMNRFRETGVHVRWVVDDKFYVGQVMSIQAELSANLFEVFTWVRVQATGEIVLVQTRLLALNTCREDERKAEAAKNGTSS